MVDSFFNFLRLKAPPNLPEGEEIAPAMPSIWLERWLSSPSGRPGGAIDLFFCPSFISKIRETYYSDQNNNKMD